MGGLRLVEGSGLSVEALARARAIYEDGFPEEWLRSEFDALFEDEVWVLVDEAGEPVGLTVVRALGDSGWTFVRYFVAGARGRGVGSVLWQALVDNRIGRGDTRIVLDVESPDEAGIDDGERSVRDRRIRFYEKNGLVLLPVDGYAPPHDEGAAHPMRLMLADLGSGAPTVVPDRDDLRAVVLGVFEHRYAQGPDAPSTHAALEASGL